MVKRTKKKYVNKTKKISKRKQKGSSYNNNNRTKLEKRKAELKKLKEKLEKRKAELQKRADYRPKKINFNFNSNSDKGFKKITRKDHAELCALAKDESTCDDIEIKNYLDKNSFVNLGCNWGKKKKYCYRNIRIADYAPMLWDKVAFTDGNCTFAKGSKHVNSWYKDCESEKNDRYCASPHSKVLDMIQHSTATFGCWKPKKAGLFSKGGKWISPSRDYSR